MRSIDGRLAARQQIGGKHMYAFYGFILQSDVDRINVMFRNAMGHNSWWTGPGPPIHCCWLWLWDLPILFNKIKFENHCLHPCSLKSKRLCHTTYVADQLDMIHLEPHALNF